MNSEFWQDKWKAGETQFHRDSPHPEMISYFTGLSARKILVPLCGKSTDLVWLHSRGHDVVGIELSEIACEAFFAENKLPVEKIDLGEGKLFRSERLALWCLDFFKVPESIWDGCAAVYDRAALVALPEEMRKRYAEFLLANWVKRFPGGTQLLITVEYASEKLIGPPFSVTENEVRSLYGAKGKITLRNSYRDGSLSGRPPKFTSIEVKESAYELKF